MALVLSPPGSDESLPEQLADLGRARKRTAVAAGVFAMMAVTLAAVALACGLDSAYDLSPLARGSALVATLTAAGVFWLRGVAGPLALRTDPLSVALELEEKHPALNDALASAVSFLGAGDPAGRGVSGRLTEAAVASARKLADRHEFDRIVPSGAFWRASWACLAVSALAAALVLLDSGRAATALARLADPFGGPAWPTASRIEILTPAELPTRLALGEPFDLKFAVRGVVKDRATLHLRVGTGPSTEKAYPLAVGADPQYPRAAVVGDRLDPPAGSFSFRVTSHDADTGWQRVDVVPPPRLVSSDGRPALEARVTPPAYTGLPPVTLILSETAALELPLGGTVELRGTSDTPLAAAAVVYLGDRAAVARTAATAGVGHLNPFAAFAAPQLAAGIGADVPLAIGADGRTVTATFAPTMAGNGKYALRLTDGTGLTGNRPLAIDATPDPAPVVNLERPAAGKEPARFTAAAVVPVRVSAGDKLYALRRTFLEYRVGREGTLRTLMLADVGAIPRAAPAVGGGPAALLHVRPTSSEVGLGVPVSAFRRDDGTPVREGDTLFLLAAADDWDDVSVLKEPGRSGEVEVVISPPEAIEAWLQKQLADLRPDLIRLRDQQRDARQKATDASPLPDGSLAPADRNRLLAAEQAQQQIRGKFDDPRDGLRARVGVLRETARANALPKSATTDRVTAVAEELGRVAGRDLAVTEPYLSEARQAGSRPGNAEAVTGPLRKALRHQQAVEDGLSNVLDLLAVWGGAGELRGEARVLREALLRQAGDIDRSGVRPDRDALRAEQAGEQAGKLLTRALRLADEKDKQAAGIRAAADEKAAQADAIRAKAAAAPAGTPEKSELAATAAGLQAGAAELKAEADRVGAEAAALRNAVAAAGGQSLPNDLTSAKDAAAAGRRDDTLASLNAAAARLGKLADALTEREPDPVPELVKPLKTAADELNALAARQDDLQKRTEDAAKIADSQKRAAALKALAAEQDKLVARGKEILQKLARDRADTRDARAALDRMEAARDDLEGGNRDTRAQADAVEQLRAAADKLDTAASSAGQQLSDEKRRKAADRVKGLLDRQKAAVAEADRLHALLAKNKKWGSEPLVAYVDLADREKAIAEEVRILGEKEFAPLPVFARLLEDAAKAMRTADDRIRLRKDDAVNADPGLAFDPELEAANDRSVSRPMALAARRLGQLLDALKPDEPKPKPKKKDPAAPPDKAPTNPPPTAGEQDLVPPEAQLRVLRALRVEVNERTAEFNKAHPDRSKLTDAEREEVKEIEQAEREILTLFGQIAKLYQKKNQDVPDGPAPENKP